MQCWTFINTSMLTGIRIRIRPESGSYAKQDPVKRGGIATLVNEGPISFCYYYDNNYIFWLAYDQNVFEYECCILV